MRNSTQDYFNFHSMSTHIDLYVGCMPELPQTKTKNNKTHAPFDELNQINDIK